MAIDSLSSAEKATDGGGAAAVSTAASGVAHHGRRVRPQDPFQWPARAISTLDRKQG